MNNVILKMISLCLGSVLVGGLVLHSCVDKHEVTKSNELIIEKADQGMVKKIIIFTSSGGRGHVSATHALTEYLSDDYAVQPVYVLKEVFGPIDFVHTLTFGNYYSEELYNYFLTHNYTWLVPAMVWFGELFFKIRYAKMVSLLREYLIQQKPDLVISVIPMINGVTLDVTQELQIPFWVVPTDLDAQKFVYQIHNPAYDKFFFNVAYDDTSLRDTSAQAALPATCMTYAGFPVRRQFIETYDKEALKLVYDIPSDKPVVMLLMGGLGSQDTLTFMQELLRVSIPMHVIVCIGKNEELRPSLKMMPMTEHVTFTIIGFTEHIAELMSISDLLITKSGGLSVNEALYMNLPMILDATSRGLVWERFNRSFIVDHEFGWMFNKVKELAPLVEDVLRNPETLARYKRTIQSLHKNNPRVEMVRMVNDIMIR